MPCRPALLAALLAPSLCLSGCSSGTAFNPAAITAAPIITGFTAASSILNAGQSTQLTWSVYGATTVTLSNGGTTQTTSSSSPVTVTPTVTTTYTLTAVNAIGTSTASFTVNVFAFTSFTASPSPVTAGSSTTLSWTTTVAPTSYSLQTTIGSTVTTAALSGTATSTVVTPSATASYVLTASTATGNLSTAPLVVQVTPNIKTFTATPSTLVAGQPVTLSWTTTGATTYTVSAVSGSFTAPPVVVYPAANTTYTLTANGSGTTSTSTAAVTVSSAAALDTSAVVTPGAPAGSAIPATFMGLSIGSTSYQAILGIPSTGTNPIYRKLLTNLTAPYSFNGGAPNLGPIVMRIGGNSADSGVVPTATTVSALAQLYKDSGTPFILGVSLEPDVVTTAVQQAQAYTGNMPSGSILGMEIGNEPDLYVQNGYRSSPYNYLSDFANFQAALAANGVAKVVGPAYSNSPSVTNIPAFVTAQASNLSVVTMHAYGGNICPAGTITLAGDYLLQETAQTRGAASVATPTVVSAVHAASLPYRIGETNSINCSGQTGVSNTFQSALWSMDWNARLAAAGVDGVNYFGDNTNAYSLFLFNSSTGTNGNTTFTINSIRPEYYGLAMWQQAVQDKGQFLPITLSTSANLKAYAFQDAAGNIRVLVLNKDEAASGVFTVTVAGYGTARLTRLTAPLYTSTNGVVYNGQTLDSSTDGTLQGTAYGEQIVPAAGVYSVAMPITSAVLLEIPHN